MCLPLAAGVGLPFVSAQDTCVNQTGCLVHASSCSLLCEWQDGDSDGLEEITEGISEIVATEEECLAQVQTLGLTQISGATFHKGTMTCVAELSATSVHP